MPQPLADVLESFAQRLDRLPDALRQELSRLVVSASGILLDLNRGYIESGKTVEGDSIQAGGYSPAYAKFKAKYGAFKNTAFVDLKLTGAFLTSLELIEIDTLEYRIVATDEKYAFLAKYGNLLGIRESDLDDFVASYLAPALELFVTNYLSS